MGNLERRELISVISNKIWPAIAAVDKGYTYTKAAVSFSLLSKKANDRPFNISKTSQIPVWYPPPPPIHTAETRLGSVFLRARKLHIFFHFHFRCFVFPPRLIRWGKVFRHIVRRCVHASSLLRVLLRIPSHT